MKRILMVMGLILLINGLASAQEPLVEIIFGPRDGDSAGTLYAFENSFIAVDVWMRTAPGISITAFHFPLSSKNEYITSRDGGSYDYQLFNTWCCLWILPANSDQQNAGYTNQSLIGACCYWEPDYIDGMHTEGEWLLIAQYFMITAGNQVFNTLFFDAFIEGYQQDNGGLILAESAMGEMDFSTYTVQYACLEFSEDNCGSYVVGDFNGRGAFNVADIITSFSKLSTGSPEPGMTCECPPGSGNAWGVAMDVNNSCAFNVADIVIAYQKLALGQPELIPCAQCPPTGP